MVDSHIITSHLLQHMNLSLRAAAALQSHWQLFTHLTEPDSTVCSERPCTIIHAIFGCRPHTDTASVRWRIKDTGVCVGELRTESGWSSLVTLFFFCHLCSLQLLLSYSTTDANLQGDLGNTPVILACSINNFEALSILVRWREWCVRTHVFIRLHCLPVMDNCPAVQSRLCSCSFYLTAGPLQLCLVQRTVSVCLSLHPFSSCLSQIKHGARLCKQNRLGHFPIHAAAFAGAKKAMEVILKNGTTKGISRPKNV